MGSFSWLKADNLTKVANIVPGSIFKLLIPKEYGGGFIKAIYQDYGRITLASDGVNGIEKYDMYELLAFWNSHLFKNGELHYDGVFTYMKEIDKYTGHNRCQGISIGCYDKDIITLKYPLKLVSCSFKGTYEDLDRPSFGDPVQGFNPLSREQYKRGESYKRHLLLLENNRKR